MTIAHLLTEFSGPEAQPEIPNLLSDLELEEERLAAFEKGYTAGWEDSLKTQDEQRLQAISGLKRGVEDLAFTYHEARAQMIASLEDIVRGLVTSVLPRVFHGSLAERLAEEVVAMVQNAHEVPVVLTHGPGIETELAEALSEIATIPIQQTLGPGLAPGEFTLRVGRTERDIDLADFLDRVSDSVEGYFEQFKREIANG